MCSACGTANDVALNDCMACGTPFTQALRNPGGPPQGIAERLARALRMIAASWRVLLLDPEVLVLPLALLLAVGGAGLYLMRWWLDLYAAGSASSAMQLGLYALAAFGLLAYVLGVFTNAAVLGCAMVRLRGGDPTLADGARALGRRLLPLLGWGLIGGLVSGALHLAESATARSRLARGAVRVAEVSWNSVTFFVVPAILFENAGPFAALGRSARLFKQRWAETLVGTVGIGFVLALVALPFMIAGFAILPDNTVAGGAIIIATLSVIVVFGSALTGIYNAALYHYALTGEALAPFRTADMQGTFYRPARLVG